MCFWLCVEGIDLFVDLDVVWWIMWLEVCCYDDFVLVWGDVLIEDEVVCMWEVFVLLSGFGVL